MAKEDYTAEWNRFRKINRSAILGFVIGLPLVMVISFLASGYLQYQFGIVLMVLSIPWAIAWGVVCFKFARFKCPRCNNLFFIHGEEEQGFRHTCSSCGLELYGN